MAHEAGALLYYDGANLNALVGLARPGDMASTSSISTCTRPSRRPRRAGRGAARRVAEALTPFLPTPRWRGTATASAGPRPPSVDRKVRSYYGNFGMLVRAYAYIRPTAPPSQRCRERRPQRPLSSVAAGRTFPMAVTSDSMHEFVATTKGAGCGAPRPGRRQAAARLRGVAPTAYFPTTVPKRSCSSDGDGVEAQPRLLAEVCAAIVAEAERDLDHVRGAPYLTPVSRVDEVEARAGGVAVETAE